MISQFSQTWRETALSLQKGLDVWSNCWISIHWWYLSKKQCEEYVNLTIRHRSNESQVPIEVWFLSWWQLVWSPFLRLQPVLPGQDAATRKSQPLEPWRRPFNTRASPPKKGEDFASAKRRAWGADGLSKAPQMFVDRPDLAMKIQFFRPNLGVQRLCVSCHPLPSP